MIGLQIAAVLACRRTRPTSATSWAIGPAIASLVLLVYPPSSTDIYAYSSFGWVAEHGENPYLRTPHSLSGDPYSRFNDWTHVRTPYGPIWTGISRGIVHFAKEEPFATALGFKIVATLAAFGLAVLTYRLARRFTDEPHQAVTVFVLVCWSPILITESAATVHLDPLMMLMAMLGLAIATGTQFRSPRLGLALTVASALVKPVTLPLIALMILVRVSSPDRIAVIARRIVLDLLVTVGIVLVAYAAFWDRALPQAMVDNAHVLYIDRPMRANPLWVWGLAHIDSAVGLTDAIGGDAGSATRWISIALAAAVTIVLAIALLRERKRAAAADEQANAQAALRFLIWAWAGVTVIIGILPVNAHPWYAIWSMAPLALLWITNGHHVRQRPPFWLLGLQSWILLSFLIYHTLPKR